MSMNGYLLAVTPDQVERLRRRPELLDRVIAGDVGLSGDALAAMLDEGLAGTRLGCLWSWMPGFVKRRLLAAITDGEEGEAHGGDDLDDDPEAADFGLPISLDKDWHLLHFALTGSADQVPGPAGDAILGGEEIGEDLGYGPARLLSGDAVRAVAAHLDRLGAAGIVGGLDLTAIPDEVYSADFAAEEDPDEVIEELEGMAEALVAFYRSAAAEGKAVVIWLA
jgi:hypothetical protein